MSKTFTDDEGNKFEEIDVQGLSDVQPQDLVIRPQQVQKEWSVETYNLDDFESPSIQIFWDNKEQAEALREVIEAIMVEITRPNSVETLIDATKAMGKARKVFGNEL